MTVFLSPHRLSTAFLMKSIDDIIAYVKKNHLDMCRLVQIESTVAIDELEKMVNIPHIDGFVFGPCDLSNDIGDHMNVYTRMAQKSTY